jgi:mannose-6-phosphate isomerase-like protein (cupin superfamily)
MKLVTSKLKKTQQEILHCHKYRSEHWEVNEGEAEVINANKTFRIKKNHSTFIFQGSKHRLKNMLSNTILKIIEV